MGCTFVVSCFLVWEYRGSGCGCKPLSLSCDTESGRNVSGCGAMVGWNGLALFHLDELVEIRGTG